MWHFRTTRARAKRELEEKHPKMVKYGLPESQDEDSPGPCKRIYPTGKNAKEIRIHAVKLAFFVENGRKCRKGYELSHRCREARKTKRSKTGSCINGKHIAEQKSRGNSKRNLHQHLIQFYLQEIVGKGWKKGAYYVSDVPEETVKRFFAAQNRPYKKVVCEGVCTGGLCFVNCHHTNE